MAFPLRHLTLRHLPRTTTSLLTAPQRRTARAVDIRHITTRPSPAILEKYRAKLDAKLKAEGVSSFDELKAAYKDNIEQLRKEAAVELPRAPVPPAVKAGLAQPPPPVPTPVAEAARRVSGGSAVPGIKPLSSYVDVEKLRVLPGPKEIEFIWRARFVGDGNSLCAAVPQEKYAKMEADAKKHPMFILPLPREGQGIEMQFLQWSFPSSASSTMIFTSLEQYRLHGEFAVPHTTLTHHLELAQEKGVVLAQGSVNRDAGVSADEARLLLISLQKFYGAGEDEAGVRRRRLLEMFSRGDQAFKIEDLVEEVERID
ncbi:ATP11 protein-domain-containing protein [Morchella snyderi]|nr:ATP11 protein-domain-containing protein [Morchella snyderi]